MEDDRYINAEKVIKEIERVYCKKCNIRSSLRCGGCEYMNCMDIIEDYPSEDVQIIVHAKWKKVTHQPTSKNFICSACYGLTTMAYECTYGYYRYCPNCGAKMDKE